MHTSFVFIVTVCFEDILRLHDQLNQEEFLQKFFFQRNTFKIYLRCTAKTNIYKQIDMFIKTSSKRFEDVLIKSFIRKNLSWQYVLKTYGLRQIFIKQTEAVARRCSVKKGILINFTKFTGKHLCHSLFLNKVSDLNVIKKRFWHRCFPVHFVKFFREPFFIEHIRWLLLNRVALTLASFFQRFFSC